MGPTAIGKTACAIELAREFPLHLISVDSVMVYRGMDVGSGKPDAETLRQYPHALVDVREPAEYWSGGDFVRAALAEIAEAHRRGRVPLLVGGTMLYFHLLLNGLAAAPPVAPALTRELLDRAEAEGWPALHAELAALDPESARRLNPRDAPRLQRALGVVLQTGVTLSDWQRGQHSALPTEARVLPLLLTAPRQTLHQRLESRLDAMFEAGLIEEVRRLHDHADLSEHSPSMRAIGYRQIWQWLDGKVARDDLRSLILRATRAHLRRQFNWLGRFRDLIAVEDTEAARAQVSAWL